MERREFLQKAAILGGAAALAPDLLASIRFEEEVHQSAPAIQHGLSGKMHLRFFPYELELCDTSLYYSKYSEPQALSPLRD